MLQSLFYRNPWIHCAFIFFFNNETFWRKRYQSKTSFQEKGWYLDDYWPKLPWFWRNTCQPLHKWLALKINWLITILGKKRARSWPLAFVFIFPPDWKIYLHHVSEHVCTINETCLQYQWNTFTHIQRHIWTVFQ